MDFAAICTQAIAVLQREDRVAYHQEARALERRAAMSLSRL